MGGENRREIVPARFLPPHPPTPSSIKLPLRGEGSVQTQRLSCLMNLCIAQAVNTLPGRVEWREKQEREGRVETISWHLVRSLIIACCTMNDGHMSISQCSPHKTLQVIDSLFFNMSRNVKLHLVSIACVTPVSNQTSPELSQTVHSPLFFRGIVEIQRVLQLMAAILICECTEGRASGIIALPPKPPPPPKQF